MIPLNFSLPQLALQHLHASTARGTRNSSSDLYDLAEQIRRPIRIQDARRAVQLYLDQPRHAVVKFGDAPG